MRWRPQRRSGRGLAAVTAVLMTAGLFSVPDARASASASSGDHVLFDFTESTCLGPLFGVITGPDGVLYGTTDFGGSGGEGCVFSLTRGGSGYTQQVLVQFTGANGAKPQGLVADANGDLFGDTLEGGSEGGGNVFELVQGTSGRYTERVLHDFVGGADGASAVGTPVLDAHGDVFGVTEYGGTGGQGVVYEMKRSSAGYTEQILHAFAAYGGQPQAGLTIGRNGTLYGTLYGAASGNPSGTVFRIQRGKAGPRYAALYNFARRANPFGALTIDDDTGVIYGTTQYGGPSNDGTVFSLTPGRSGYTEQILHAFDAKAGEGFDPEGTLLLTAQGDLIGTAALGGVHCSGIGCGTIFELVPAGSGYSFQVLHQFTGPPDGAAPQWSGLIPGSRGTLIGTTRSGGAAQPPCYDGGPGGVLGCGTVYRVTPPRRR